jgi:hypothetical protein
MAKADVTSLVSSLANAQSDATAVSSYYDRIVFEHGMQRESLTGAAYVAVVSGTTNYSLPTSAIRGVGFFYDEVWLYPEDNRGAETVDPYWRSRLSEPRAVLFENTDSDTFDIVPGPIRAGAAVGGATPFTTFPADNLTVIYTNNAADVQPWEELMVACDILAREFARDSDHHRADSAQAWRQAATFLRLMVDG